MALNGQHYASLADAQHAGAPTLNFGLFINAIINFVIVGVRHLLGGEGADAGCTCARTPSPAPKAEELLAEIRDILKAQAAARPTQN